MKYPVRRFKSLEVGLKEIESFVRNCAHLQTGKAFKQLGDMRSREVLANLLVCITIREIEEADVTFSSDPVGGDGIIQDVKTGETWPTEHVMVTHHGAKKDDDAKSLLLKAIDQKRRKGGEAYARGKTLIVFLDAPVGEWKPNVVARELPEPLLFAAVWVVGLRGVEDGEYVYNVTCLDISKGDAPAFYVRINKTFDRWVVTPIQ
jgi:hypothetical protein